MRRTVLLCLLFWAVRLGAAPIPIMSTGLAAPGSVDPNWTITASPSGPGSAWVTDTSDFPFGPWMPNSGTSAWISPQPSYTANQTDPALSTHWFETTFSIAGLDPPTASITFNVAADNLVTDILLNGASTGITAFGFSAFNGPFTVSSGFVEGLNRLTVIVDNSMGDTSNPVGLRLDVLGTADISEVPEPASIVLIGLGLALLGRRLTGERSKS